MEKCLGRFSFSVLLWYGCRFGCCYAFRLCLSLSGCLQLTATQKQRSYVNHLIANRYHIVH